MRLNHLHLKTSNLQSTRRFYEQYFGFRQAFDHDGGAFLLDEGGFLLALFEYKKGELHAGFPTWYHHGFCLTSEEAVRDLYTMMRKHGVEFTQPLKEWSDGAVTFYCLDPAGYKVEVSWHPEEAQLIKERQAGAAVGARR